MQGITAEYVRLLNRAKLISVVMFSGTEPNRALKQRHCVLFCAVRKTDVFRILK